MKKIGKGKHRRLSALFLSVVVLGALCVGCKAQQGKNVTVPEFVLTYAENQAEDYPTTLGAYRFAELVHERTLDRLHNKIGIIHNNLKVDICR